MSYLINNQQKLNDIIFADRNKAYGAYVLRSSYGNTILKSIFLMLLGVGSMLSIAVYLSNKNKPDENLGGHLFIKDSAFVVEFNVEKKKEPSKHAEKTPIKKEKVEKIESTDYTKIDSTYDAKTTNRNEISVATFTSNTTDENTNSPNDGTGTLTEVVGFGKSDSAIAISDPFQVDSEPQFEGGLKALYRFVSYHLKYPNWASSEGKEGTVFVKFVVDENGKVGRLSLLNTLGFGMDDEAMRVVSLIPKFKSPAKIKGQAVKAYYQLPIRFTFSKY
ncbi:energy transducer TonB [Aurantibacillus circumpalustris]|uniref:energy transducer TonB n=1 Tax=Aurantibacillus circumpalustris TaxID=3036359 RepID=UPI00295AC1AA|nr:TonB family protein [Aurantibacillus circumpalustris]